MEGCKIMKAPSGNPMMRAQFPFAHFHRVFKKLQRFCPVAHAPVALGYIRDGTDGLGMVQTEHPIPQFEGCSKSASASP